MVFSGKELTMDVDRTSKVATKLTSRQGEFLSSLLDLYRAHRRAISYTEVAAAMKVSKWTAYDILRGLYQRGFLRMEHAVPAGKGRSQILYRPSEQTPRIGEDIGYAAEARAVQWMLKVMGDYAGYGIAESIRLVARSVRQEKNAFRVVLRVCLMVVLFASWFSLDMDQLVHTRALVASGVSADTVLGVLGEIMFSLMRDEEWFVAHLGLPQQAMQEFVECEQIFRINVAQLSAGEKRLMVTVIGRALAL